MKYKMFDGNKIKFIGTANKKRKIKDVVFIPIVSYKENNLTFDEWFDKLKTATENFDYQTISFCHNEFPRFMELWETSLMETVKQTNRR